ncbi:MAG: electron transfer flavoprotein subunit beta/FixA family protein [Lachnospiraceae bacterium]|nr:electron transfer flavoprotein subunit beta/FixA family protein [Lachnospiraceae bacterium]
MVLDTIVCIKQVPDMEEIYEQDRNQIGRTEISLVVNPLDYYALSIALRLKKTYGGTVRTLSMGPSKCEKSLMSTMFVGVDESILITGDEFAGADTYATAYTLANAIRNLKNYNLIITGNKSIDGDTGQVGAGIAEFLNVSNVTNVSKILQINDKSICVRKKTEQEYFDVELPIPAVLSVTEDICEMIYPNINDIISSRKREVFCWGINDFDVVEEKVGSRGSKTMVAGAYKESNLKNCVVDYNKQKDTVKIVFQEIVKGII